MITVRWELGDFPFSEGDRTIRGYDNINPFEFHPIANALKENIESKESPNYLLSYLEILHLSRKFIDEINDEHGNLRDIGQDAMKATLDYFGIKHE